MLHSVLTSRSEGEQADGEPEHVPDNYGLQSYWNESYAGEAYGHLYDWCAVVPDHGVLIRRLGIKITGVCSRLYSLTSV